MADAEGGLKGDLYERKFNQKEAERIYSDPRRHFLAVFCKYVAVAYSGADRSGAGGARGFDTIAAETVLELKKDYPQIKLILVLPCRDQTKGWLEADIRKYNAILEKANKVVYTSDHYFRGCMHVRNRHLVDHSKYCICYLTKASGGTAFTINYAKKQGLEVQNIK